jgi:dihydrofolate synthase/folylpolyglutamate synthase
MNIIRTAAEAGAFLESLVLAEPRSYAERARYALQAVAALLDRLDNPQRQLKIIHITGSKGKGSTALLLEAILRAAGLRTGTYTSPHLQRWSERYRIDGQEIAAERFAALMELLRPHVTALQTGPLETRPSFFDAATAAALLLFQQEKVDYAIVEVGLGGRLDATNIVEPVVTCITSIELEHTDKLGHTLAAIAAEKAGIIKPAVPVVVGRLPGEAERVITLRAAEQQAPLLQFAGAFRLEPLSTSINGNSCRLISDDLDLELELPLLGEHVTHNAALAAICARQLAALDQPMLEQAIRQGLHNAVLPGRCEIISRDPWIVVDGAHTVQSAAALRRLLESLPVRHVHWLLSLTVRKNPHLLCDVLLRPGDRLTLTKADGQRSQEPDAIAALIRPYYSAVEIEVIAEPAAAVRHARSRQTADTLLCITGSVYMAGLGRGIVMSTLR